MGTQSCDLLRTFTEQASAGEAKTEPKYYGAAGTIPPNGIVATCSTPSFLTPCTKMEEVKPGHSLPTSYLPTWALVHYIHYIWFLTLHSSVHRVRTVPCVVSGGLPHFDPTPCVFFVHMIGRSKLDVIFHHVSCVYPCPICTWKNSLGSYTIFKLLGFNPPPSPKLYISPLNPYLFLRACETMGRWPGHTGTV